jgi:transposase
MGKRKRDRQPTMWVATTDFPTAASHPFYTRLNQLLRQHAFDDFAEAQCASFYAEPMGRPSLPPGTYFRLLLLIGYFEGIDSERGIAWRAADSFALRDVLGVGLEEAPPDHSTISRTRRLIDLETHRAVFTWVLQCLSTAGLVKGKTIGIDATTLEANAALRSIVRRDTGESYEEFLTKLAKASGIGTPTRALRLSPELKMTLDLREAGMMVSRSSPAIGSVSAPRAPRNSLEVWVQMVRSWSQIGTWISR